MPRYAVHQIAPQKYRYVNETHAYLQAARVQLAEWGSVAAGGGGESGQYNLNGDLQRYF